MKKNRNKNYTLYWMMGISAVLTVPISVIIIKKVQAGNVEKTVFIMAVFLVLFFAIMLLYRNIFGVTVQEITQEEKVTELDRLNYVLLEQRKKHSHLQVRKNIDIILEQIQRFKRRKNIMFEVAGEELCGADGGALGDLVQNVEDALVYNFSRQMNNIEIFDDQGMPEVTVQSLRYIEELVHKNNEILMEFETLITETSRMGETHQDKDISKLKDVVNAMQSLRTNRNDIDDLAKKYE